MDLFYLKPLCKQLVGTFELGFGEVSILKQQCTVVSVCYYITVLWGFCKLICL